MLMWTVSNYIKPKRGTDRRTWKRSFFCQIGRSYRPGAMDGAPGGLCECWRHTVTYLTYWLCVKSHPLNKAARCVALLIYSTASTLYPSMPRLGISINAISSGAFFCRGSLPSLKSNTIRYCLGGLQDDYIHAFMVKTLSQLLCCSGSANTDQNPRYILFTPNVTGFNPACDLFFWMSYPRRVRSCCCSAAALSN